MSDYEHVLQLMDDKQQRSDDRHDIEKQPMLDEPESETFIEDGVATRTKILALGLWLGLNIALTIYNKAALVSFHWPWMLTTIHASCAFVGSLAMLVAGRINMTPLTVRDNATLVAFSFLFTINIAISNVSLAMVSVPFHQTMRSASPVVAIAAYRVLYSRSYSTETYLSLLPIMVGVGLATRGDYEYTPLGFVLTLSGVVMAVFKTIMSNRLMTGRLALTPGEILVRMSPMAAVQSLLFAFMTGELNAAHATWKAHDGLGWMPCAMLLGNGVLAFVLNVSSFQSNRLAGALALSVAGNLKQCLTILLGILLFNVKVTLANGLGMCIALAGVAWYSKAELATRF